MTAHVLDDWVGDALRGDHRTYALAAPGVVRYDPGVAVFGSVTPDPATGDLRALDAMPADDIVLPTLERVEVPPGWQRTREFPVLQMVDDGVGALDPEPFGAPLTAADVPAMLELVAIAQPGPFARRTIELGGYVGVREEGRLVAMAGRRAAPTGWTELSALCTHPDFRGRGYGRRLLLEVLRGIRADGRRGFLTVLETNPAKGLYESLGFVPRRRFVLARLARKR
ncbi:MAG: GNAT family N-acetyltransferase [Acidobacteria bacterium]|nr:GNAT family N-acetyltransferase [Acidobacteriota bacterium]